MMSAVVLLAPLMGPAVYAQNSENEPAQMPLIVEGVMASPNIMLSFDNSGSMNDLTVPEDLAGAVFNAYYYNQTFHPHDRSDNGTSTSSQKSLLASDVTSGSTQMRAGRSPQINLIYYNPTIHYEPWKKPNSDGSGFSSMPEPNPRAAPVYVTSSSVIQTINLALYQEEILPWPSSIIYCNGGLRSVCNSNGRIIITPALYFIYKGPGAHAPDFGYANNYYNEINNASNYTTVAIMAGEFVNGLNISELYRRAPENPQGRSYNTADPNADNYIRISRPDCKTLTSASGDVICTQQEELQNFTNWYVYYRGRTRAAIGALTQVFAKDYGMHYRLGWGDYTSYVRQHVRPFVGGHPDTLYQWLYDLEHRAITGTPTPAALNAIGNYYETNTGAGGPWSAEPGNTSNRTSQLACRRSYAILVTDGGWGSSITLGINGGNIDGEDGDVITNASGRTYRYIAAGSPFSDNHSGTLADVAMYYWKRDLHPNLPNEVPGNSSFWQNVITHTVGFGVTGTLDPAEVWQKVQEGARIDWPKPTHIAAKIDDLLHAAVNGHGTYSSASNVAELINSFGSIMESLATADITAPHQITATGYLEAGNIAYVPSYVTSSWTGELTAYTLTNGGKKGDIKWVASTKIPSYASRNIWIGSTAGPIEFVWSKVSQNEGLKAVLYPDHNDVEMERLVEFLRGNNDFANGMMFRSRGSNILGDIVNSNPILVGAKNNLRYGHLPASVLGKTVYNLFANDAKRADHRIIFIGANDGMLHAFNADSGVEVFAYIPGALAGQLSQLASDLYDKNHRFYVDGPLTLTDASIGGGCTLGADYSCWRNVLLGSAGAGAKTVFALDVTDPAMFSRSDIGNNPSVDDIKKTVLWELTPQTDDGVFADLGNVLQPLQAGYIRYERAAVSTATGKNERWVAVFGNGAHSINGQAVLFIVDLKTGELIKSFAVGDAGGNGLMGVTLIRDSNQVIIGAYAGDLKGNLWRFTFGDGVDDWDVTYKDSGNKPKPLFTTDHNRPIFQAPVYMPMPDPKSGYMVLFGTGKYFDIADISDMTTESLYGIWDNNSSTVSYANLLKRAMKVAASGYYDLVDRTETVNWDTQRGWVLPLSIKDGLRSLFTPVISGSNIIFTASFANVTQDLAESCEVKGVETSTIVLNIFSGGLPSIKWADTNHDGVIDDQDIPYIGFPTNSSGPERILITPGMTGNAPINSGLISCPHGVLTSIGCSEARDNTAWTQLF